MSSNKQNVKVKSEPGAPLQRGSASHANTIAAGPSVIFDEETGTAINREPSPLPSQIALEEGKVLTRQKPKFHNVQDLDLALHQAIEGKITVKNAWASREASDLLEGIIHTIESTLDGAGNSTDDYSGFAKAATVVEGCSKVWTSRVDSTYNRSNQMVRRLLRNDDTTDAEKNDDEANEGDPDDPENAARLAELERKKKKKIKNLVRTVALDPNEINLDRKAKTALISTGLNAQFRAITEKFDQGNAHGLLIHNAPLGLKGNYILDVDFAQSEFALDQQPKSPQRTSRDSKKMAVKDEEEEKEKAENAGIERKNQEAAPDAYINMELTDLPTFTPVMSELDGSGIERPTAPTAASKVASARGSSIIDPLLAVPHMKEERAEALASSLNVSRRGSVERSSQLDTFNGANRVDNEDDDNNQGDWGDDWGDGGGGGGDDYDYADQDDANAGGQVSGDIANEARMLASGAREVQQLDNLLSTTQLALEAEDPSSWCPLTQQKANPLLEPRGELSKLHKHHRFSANAADDAPGQGTAATAAAKKANKKDRTVVFKFEEDALEDLPSNAHKALSKLKTMMDGPLKQSTTAAKNMTPLGKEVVVDKDAPQAVVAYTQSAVQRRCAEQGGLLLPNPPIPGKTIPSHLPYPVEINSFFQMFSTNAPQWNLLRKSASGQLISSSAPTGSRLNASGRISGHSNQNGENLNGEGVDFPPDMPVEFFPGGAETDYDYDMGEQFGPDDNDDSDADIYRHNLQLMAQFDALHAERSARQSYLTSGRPTGSGELHLMAPLEMAKVLQPMEATTPNQVDVVKLRESMWSALKLHVEQNEYIDHEGIDDPRHKDEDIDVGRGGRRGRSPPPQAMLKKHAAKVLLERVDSNQEARRGGKRPHESQEEDDDEEENSQTPQKRARLEDLPHFSDVVRSVLPTVPGISSTGTLSPAFFFFSILFLANEHNVLLENVESLDDMVIKGFVKSVA